VVVKPMVRTPSAIRAGLLAGGGGAKGKGPAAFAVSKGQTKGPPKGVGKAASAEASWAKGGKDRGDKGSVWVPGKGAKGDKGKGKFKGKGKKGAPPAPPADDEFWQVKMAQENRQVLGGTFSGTITAYNKKFGWGFILPDNVEELPEEAQIKIAEASEQAVSNGKSAQSLLYFRKPDITEGCEADREKACTFSLYVDDKGAGALEVTC